MVIGLIGGASVLHNTSQGVEHVPIQCLRYLARFALEAIHKLRGVENFDG